MVRVVDMEFAKFRCEAFEVKVLDDATKDFFTMVVETPKGTYRDGGLDKDFAWEFSDKIFRMAEARFPYAIIDKEIIFDSLLRLFKR